MIKLIDVVYYFHDDLNNPHQILEKHAASLGFVSFIRKKLNIQLIKHCDYEGKQKINEVEYIFFKSKNRFLHIPFKTHRYIKDQQPDVVIVEGLIFPLQVIALKIQVGKYCKIIVQHHGEKPFSGVKRLFQKLADRYIDAYIFTAYGNAEGWINKKIIKSVSKCVEVLEASTYFTQQNKKTCKTKLGLSNYINFLWVGRLNVNKDPLTVLKAFESFAVHNPNVKLYMIYQTEELLAEMKNVITKSSLLKQSVILKGRVVHDEMKCWYSAADFFISASHKEGSGYALLEAMSCGCIPVVTNIPPFKKITGEGKFGFLFMPGNTEQLSNILNSLPSINQEAFSADVVSHFKNNLSFKNIADDIFSVCSILTGK